ncbi:MAG: GtrA family protein [Deltaproteobacteria bacterium]|nr:GtrA family protein [Deltaproteobacteria bacterium]
MKIPKQFFDIVKKSWFRQFIVYGLVGGISTALDWGSFYLMSKQLGLHYLICVIISIFLGSSANFILNRIVTFKDKSKRVVSQLALYVVASAVSMLLSSVLMFCLVDIVGIDSFLARIMTTFILYPINFLLLKLFVFNASTGNGVGSILLNGGIFKALCKRI